MTLYKSDNNSGLMTYATDGSLIRFIDGQFKATKKAQRDVLDKLKGVRKVEDKASSTEQKPAKKTATKAKPVAKKKASK